jgi:hypothetical protein
MMKKPYRRLICASSLLLMVLACTFSISLPPAAPTVQVVPVTQIIVVTQVIPPEPSSPTPFEVYAHKGWQNTNISVSPTDMVTVRYISGQWTGGIGKGHWYDGRGDLIAKYKCVENYDPNMCDEPIPYVYNGTLVGRIGQDIFEIGNYLQFKPRQAGTLFLRMNDHDEGLYDNEGVLKVEIEIKKKR